MEYRHYALNKTEQKTTNIYIAIEQKKNNHSNICG